MNSQPTAAENVVSLIKNAAQHVYKLVMTKFQPVLDDMAKLKEKTEDLIARLQPLAERLEAQETEMAKIAEARLDVDGAAEINGEFAGFELEEPEVATDPRVDDALEKSQVAIEAAHKALDLAVEAQKRVQAIEEREPDATLGRGRVPRHSMVPEDAEKEISEIAVKALHLLQPELPKLIEQIVDRRLAEHRAAASKAVAPADEGGPARRMVLDDLS